MQEWSAETRGERGDKVGGWTLARGWAWDGGRVREKAEEGGRLAGARREGQDGRERGPAERGRRRGGWAHVWRG